MTGATYLSEEGSQVGIVPGPHAIPDGMISGAGQPVRGSGTTSP